MRVSQLFNQTLREAPGDARTPGQQFLVRAGFVRSLGGSGLAFLPLGVQARQRLVDLAERGLRDLGGQPVAVPRVQLVELASAADRSTEGGAIRFRDRGQRQMVVVTEHSGAILAAAGGVIQSYKQLPALLYETWPVFRNEERATGGLWGAQEGLVLDAYSLHAGASEVDEVSARVRAALERVCIRCDVAAYPALAAAGHKLIYPLGDGEAAIARCHACGYAADQAAAHIAKTAPVEEPLPMRDVETPACKTIAELASFLDISPARTAKAVFLMAEMPGAGSRFVFAVVRGDTALDEGKLKAVLQATALGPATEDEICAAGAVPGYGSPVGLSGVTVVVDDLAAASPNLVAGANRAGYHTLNVNYGRDYTATAVADIAMAQDGSPCPACGAALTVEHGSVLLETWQADEATAAAAGITYLDRTGTAHPLGLGRYRLYIDRLIAAMAECHHDAQGFLWPAAVAPYQAHLLTLGKASAEVVAAAERIYAELSAAGIAILYDDRDERAGVKFNDADLIGAPVRVAVGDRGLKAGTAEVKRRNQTDVQAIPFAELVAHVVEGLRA